MASLARRSPLGSSGDEAEIDQADLRSPHKWEMKSRQDRCVEAPAMDEHEMHQRARRASANALRGSAGVSSTSSRLSTSASLCAAVKASLSRAVPAGTVGGLIAVAKKPRREAAC